MVFRTFGGLIVPAVTGEQMREVDRIAVEEFGLGILQMMENAGRNLALHAIGMLAGEGGRSLRKPKGLKSSPPSEARGSSPRSEGGRSLRNPEGLKSSLPSEARRSSPRSEGGRSSLHREGQEIAVMAGSGGNGGGGLCCARHLHNRGFPVSLLLSRDPVELGGAAGEQLRILRAAGVEPVHPAEAENAIRRSSLVVDALVGYSLRGAPRGRVAELIGLSEACGVPVLSLDLPSGLNATTGQAPGVVVRPERTVTLALPKTGLRDVSGELYVADIGIPPELYERLGIPLEPPFGEHYWVRLIAVEG